MTDILQRQWVKVAFSVSQMINGIQNVGFSDTVFPYKAIDFCIEIERSFGDVLVIEERKFLEMHLKSELCRDFKSILKSGCKLLKNIDKKDFHI